mmetsp:Transcript_43381/g.51015  ORF Transcript_43381/g.51015 Transcript_43381/m.51015 type:complete len:104 (+) Transcript_43381:1-312(+)
MELTHFDSETLRLLSKRFGVAKPEFANFLTKAPRDPKQKQKFKSDKSVSKLKQINMKDHYFNQRYYEEKQNMMAKKYNVSSSSETRQLDWSHHDQMSQERSEK